MRKKAWKDMTMLEYINSEKRGFFIPDMGTNGLELIGGCTLYEVYENPLKQLELAKKMDEVFDGDFVYTACDGMVFCEALDMEIVKPDDDFPSVLSHPFKTIEDIERIKYLDPYKDSRMPKNLESIRLLSENMDKPVYEAILGPFTLAIQMAGATHLLGEIIRNPEFVEKILEFTTDLIRRYAIASEKSGANYITLSEPGAVTLSPERFEKYVVPNVNKILDSVNTWKGMHICGDTTFLIDSILKCNIDAISLDQILDYEKIAPLIPSDMVLIGNLDPVDLVGRGTVDEIEREAKLLKKKMKNYKNYLCGLGCDCLNDTPVENLKKVIEVAKSEYYE